MSRADEGRGLDAIERRLADDDPGLAEAFQKWQVPAEVVEARAGETTAPPWALAVFMTAAVSWVVSAGFGLLAAAVALSWILLTADLRGRGRPGSRRAADSGEADEPAGINGPDDGELSPHTWRGRWI